MILQALTRYYDILASDPEIDIARFGYSTVGVSFALDISEDGELLEIVPQFQQEQRGKKMVEVPRSLVVPETVKRTVNPESNFLWDNATYTLGVSDKAAANPAYATIRFNAFREKQRAILAGVDSTAAKAILRFLDRHDPATAAEHPVISRHLADLYKGGNLVFRVNGTFVHQDPAIRKVWDALKASSGAVEMQCLVTGEVTPIARLHPSLKRVRGAQPTGATLVGFNAVAYESYNRSQGLISPVSEAATFAYTTVLNYLLSDANPNKKFYMGDATIVYWAESENRDYEPAYASLIEPPLVEVDEPDQARLRAEGALRTVAVKVRRTQALDLDAMLEPLKDDNPRFYILGLAPNAARAAVRFFVSEPFSEVVDNIMSHYRDLEIVKEYDNQDTYITIREIFSETVSKKSTDKNASPLLSGAVLRAILTNQPYPAALYYAILNRVRVDMDDTQAHIQKINYVRAAVIKAYLKRKYRTYSPNPYPEVLAVSLNDKSTNTAYLLGRLFAVLEKAQRDAIGKDINATIKDRYFAAACGSPRNVFPTLLRLSNHWISKSEKWYADQEIQRILTMLDVDRNPFPARLSLDEQGIFILGYYHERAFLYTKSGKTEVEAAVAVAAEESAE